MSSTSGTGQRALIFSLPAGREFAECVANCLHGELAPLEERQFEDGEFKIRPLTEVRNRTAVVLQSLCSHGALSVNDVLLRVLFLLATLRDAGAAQVHLVAPYFCYGRKDRRTQAQDPLSLRYIAQLVEAVGVHSVTTLEAHNPAAFENAFRIPVIHLTGNSLFSEYFSAQTGKHNLTVATPDIGGARRAEALRSALGTRLGMTVGSAMVPKQRSGGVVSGGAACGEIRDRQVIILDDMIVSGTTVLRAAGALQRAGAREMVVAATHAVFAENAVAALGNPVIEHIVVTNSVPLPVAAIDKLGQRLRILDLAPLIADAVRSLTRTTAGAQPGLKPAR